MLTIYILITMAGLFCVYEGAMFLFSVGAANFTWIHMLILIFTVILAGFSVWSARRAWKLWKRKAAQLNAAYQKQEALQRQKRREMYFEYDAQDAAQEDAQPAQENSGISSDAEAQDDEDAGANRETEHATEVEAQDKTGAAESRNDTAKS